MFELDPRLESDTIFLGDLKLCRVLLMNDSQYPWIILVPRVSDIMEIYELSDQQRQILAEESNQVTALLSKEFSADKMNVAALGNVVSQLHIHHIVRYQNDPAWPAPVWGAKVVKPYPEKELEAVCSRLRNLFEQINSFDSQ